MNQSYLSVNPNYASYHGDGQLSKSELKIHETELNKKYNQEAIDGFPFGREGVRISNFVSKQLNSDETDSNARILQQFRRKAVESRFNRFSKNKEKYITENMLPGVSGNPTLAEKVVATQLDQRRFQDPPELKPGNWQPRQLLTPAHSQHRPSHQQFLQHSPGQNSNGHSFAFRPQPPITANIQPVSMSQQVDLLTSNNSRAYNNPEHEEYPPSHSSGHTLELSEKANRASQTSLKRKQRNLKAEANLMKKQYYQMKIRSQKKEEKHLSSLELILKGMNREIEENSQKLHKIVRESEGGLDGGGTVYLAGNTNSRRVNGRVRTEADGDLDANGRRQRDISHKNYRKWRLNEQLMEDKSMNSTFLKHGSRKKPKIKYSSDNTTSFNTIDIPNRKALHSSQAVGLGQEGGVNDKREMYRFFGNRRKKTLRNFDSQQEIKSNIEKQSELKSDGQLGKVREHLRLLKKHSNRLQKLNSLSFG